MEENKYYTPKIEEFHIGFNYQYDIRYTYTEGDYVIDDGENWIDCVFGEPDDTNIWDIDNEIEEGLIRVKCLDKSDIESCGFKKIEIEQNCDRFFTGRYYLPNTDYKLFFDVLNGKRVYICINEKWEDYPSGKVIFVGNINNISELQQALKMIGVV